MIIGVCGYGYTGSGAYLDLLKEFEDVCVIDDYEFDFVYLPDGIEDLYYHLCINPTRYLSGNTSIKRFMHFINEVNTLNSAYVKGTNGLFFSEAEKFINKCVQLKWKGIDIYDKYNASFWGKNINYRILLRIINFLEKILKRKIKIKPYCDMFLSVNPENFIQYSKDFIKTIIDSRCTDKAGTVVLNQPFTSDNPQNYFKYYDCPYALIVDKDPRDIYILAKEILLSNGSFIPTDNVYDFIYYFKRIHEYRSENKKNVFTYRFEDIIYEYDKTVSRLQNDFSLGIHKRKKKFFSPEISINNTQLYLRYPQYKNDVKVIENELSQWLFPFDNYNKPNFNAKPF